MTEFFQPPTHVRADGNGRVSYMHRTCRAQSNRRRVTHSIDIVTNLMHLVKCLLHDSWTGVNESSQKDKLVSELVVGNIGLPPRNK